MIKVFKYDSKEFPFTIFELVEAKHVTKKIYKILGSILIKEMGCVCEDGIMGPDVTLSMMRKEDFKFNFDYNDLDGLHLRSISIEKESDEYYLKLEKLANELCEKANKRLIKNEK